MLRDAVKSALVAAMKAKDDKAVTTLRMAQSAIKNRDIELRGGNPPAPGSAGDDAMIIDVLGKMVKQRRESVTLYRDGGRNELAAAEEAEIALLEQFLPKQMDEAQARVAIGQIIAETGASSVKDMGKVMGLIKTRFAGQIDMGRAGGWVKDALNE